MFTPAEATSKSPQCLVVMGVSACGKSVVGQAVANQLAAVFIDGDDHHPVANVAKMTAGMPLDETDRLPWLDALHAIMQGHLADAPADCLLIVACSALRRRYRDRLRGSLPQSAVRFVHLDLDFATALQRIESRRDHFMKGRHMLENQFETLEPLADDERANGSFAVDARPEVAAVATDIIERLAG